MFYLLQDVLTQEEKEQIDSRVNAALRNLSEVYMMTKPKERHYIARALRQASLTRDESRLFGFLISKHLWSTCLNTEKRDVGGKC